MENKLKAQLNDFKAIDRQRRGWLTLSAFVIAVIAFVIFSPNTLREYHILSIVGILGITLSVIWWYWAMRTVNILIHHRQEEVEVLQDLCLEIKEIKDDVRNSLAKDLDQLNK